MVIAVGLFPRARKVLLMVYTIEQLRERIAPIAKKHNLCAVWVFGSYARNEATDESDIDILIDRTNSTVHTLFQMGGVYNDICKAVDKRIDLLTTGGLMQECTKYMSPDLAENVYNDREIIYERQ